MGTMVQIRKRCAVCELKTEKCSRAVQPRSTCLRQQHEFVTQRHMRVLQTWSFRQHDDNASGGKRMKQFVILIVQRLFDIGSSSLDLPHMPLSDIQSKEQQPATSDQTQPALHACKRKQIAGNQSPDLKTHWISVESRVLRCYASKSIRESFSQGKPPSTRPGIQQHLAPNAKW